MPNTTGQTYGGNAPRRGLDTDTSAASTGQYGLPGATQATPNTEAPSESLSTRNVDVDRLQADITREQYEDYLQRYRPVERQYSELLTDPEYVSRGVERAGERVASAYQLSEDAAQRERDRYGIQMTGDQAATIRRMRELGQSVTTGAAKNATRTRLDDLRLSGLSRLAGYGRGLASQAGSIAGGVAGRAQRIDNANDRLEAQSQSQALGLAGTGAGIALAASGPVGWGIGGGLAGIGVLGAI